MVGLGEKLGTDPWIDQLSCCGLGRELFFSGAVALLNSIDDYTKGCYMQTTKICMVEDHMRIGHEKSMACWSGFPLQSVHRFKSPRLSDMSNHLFVTVSM
jgi:hypothetical protein